MNFDTDGKRLSASRTHKEQIEDGLKKCRTVARILKEFYPNELPALEKNFIVPFTSSKRLCNSVALSGLAHYHTVKPHRICMQQKFLRTGHDWDSEYEYGHQKRGTGRYVDGTLGYILLTCHELAHHRTKGHGANWYAKYHKFRDFMIRMLVNGQYYKSLTWVGGESV